MKTKEEILTETFAEVVGHEAEEALTEDEYDAVLNSMDSYALQFSERVKELDQENLGLNLLYKSACGDIIRAEDRIKELEAQQQWISVKERKPEKHTTVVMSHDSHKWVCNGEFDGRQWYNEFDESEVPVYPTHWRPLHSPPNQSVKVYNPGYLKGHENHES